jgi:nicotinamidase/pyrazinamidase
MAEKAALLVVDVHNDFCPGGALAVPEGDKVVPVINAYIRRFVAAGLPVFASRDWHPAQTRHFVSGGGVWPPHCVQDTPGAAFHPDLRLPDNYVLISKGADPQDDSYSVLDGKGPSGEMLEDLMKDMGVEHLFVGGLATDYCVKFSVLDARRLGFTVTVLEDASRGVEVQPGDSAKAIEEMKAAGADFATLETVQFEAGAAPRA